MTVNKISSLREAQQDSRKSISGQGMDRRVAKKTPLGRKLAYGIAGLLVLLFTAWLVSTLLAGRSLSVNSERIAVSDVTVGTFEDFIPLRGRLVPRNTVYLDAVEGGRVEEVLVEDGAIVRAGDPIVRGGEVLTGGIAPYNTYTSKDGAPMTLASLEPHQ